MGVKQVDIPKQSVPDFPAQEVDVELNDSEVVKTPEPTPVVEDKPVVEAAPVSAQALNTQKPSVEELLENQKRALQEERAKRKELEQKLKEIELSSALSELDDNDLSEEGKALKQQLAAVNQKLKGLEDDRRLERVLGKYPQLKDKRLEFDSYRESRSDLPVEDAAKVFLIENDLVGAAPVRKGLERPTGGGKQTPQSSGYTPEDIDRIRSTQPRKFIQMVRSGQFDSFIEQG